MLDLLNTLNQTMNPPTLIEIREALKTLYSFSKFYTGQRIALIQLDHTFVSILTSEKWKLVGEIESLGFVSLITCANISTSMSGSGSLKFELETLEQSNEYLSVVNKVKSFGLTDDEIKTLQQGQN